MQSIIQMRTKFIFALQHASNYIRKPTNLFSVCKTEPFSVLDKYKTMNAVIIGISSGLLIIVLVVFFKQIDKKIIYGLILSGIGFIYVGFVWTDSQALVINAVQAVIFFFLGYYGIKKRIYILAAGYFLHGCWDMLYDFFKVPGSIPPHYDLFCSSLDFTIALYLLVFNKWISVKRNLA